MACTVKAGFEQDAHKCSKELHMLIQAGGYAPPQQRPRCISARGPLLILLGAILGAALLLGSRRYPPVAEQAEGIAKPLMGWETTAAECFLDVDQGVFFLMEGANAISYANGDCKETSYAEGRRVCAADITTAIGGMIWSVNYLQFAVLDCSERDSYALWCSGAAVALVGTLSEFATIAASVTDSCELDARRLHARPGLSGNATGMPNMPTSASPHRWLAESKSFFGKYSERLRRNAATLRNRGVSPYRATTISSCVVDADLSAAYLARIGLEINYLNSKCPSDKKVCIVNVFYVISSIAWAAIYLSALAVDCPAVYNYEADCASSVANFVGNLATLGSIVVDISGDCQPGNLA